MLELVNNVFYTSLFVGGISMFIMIIEVFTANKPLKKPYSGWLMFLSFTATISFFVFCITTIWKIWI